MKRFKAKLATLLAAVSCFVACVGFGVVSALAGASTTITASAATSYTVNSLLYSGGDAKAFDAIPNADGRGKPGVGSWTEVYTLQSGTGFQLNGAPAEVTLKYPHDFYIELAAEAKAGDKLTVDGTFYNATTDTTFIFKKCGLTYNGSTWDMIYNPYTVSDLQPTSVSMDASHPHTKSTRVYLKPNATGALPIQTWDYFFKKQSGGLTLNGEAWTIDEMKSTDAGLYVTFPAVATNDVLTLSGKFTCDGVSAEYTITESSFKWNGSTWEAVIKYNEAKATAVGAGANSGATAVYLYPTAGVSEFPDGNDSEQWLNVYTFEEGSGKGMTLGGVALNTTDIKLPGRDLYIGLGTTAKAGDIFTIDGAYYNNTTKIKLIFDNCALKYNGSAWEPCVVYDEYTATEIAATAASNASALYIYPTAEITAFPDGNDSEQWLNFYTFEEGSGKGMTLAGVALTTTDIKLPGTDFFVALGATAKAGDIFTIDGAYYNNTTKIKLIFDNCALKYNGTTWETYVEYKTYNLGTLTLHANSKPIGAAGTKNDQLYLERTDEQALPIQSWDYAFVAENADCFKINNKAATLLEMKSTNGGLFLKFNALKAGDVVTFGGTFVSDALLMTYVIKESKFVWNGESWEVYVEQPTIIYDEYVVTAIASRAASDASALHIYSTAGDRLPEGDWDNVYTFEVGSGAGMTLAGAVLTTTDIKLPGDFYVNMKKTAKAGDIFTIDGAYYNDTTKVKIIFEDCALQYNGTTWETYVNSEMAANEYNLGSLSFKVMQDGDNSMAYFNRADGQAFPSIATEDKLWEAPFSYEYGTITLNGENVTPTVKFPTAAFFDFASDPKTGDVLVISGDFYNATYDVKYTIMTSIFEWNGSAWVGYKAYNLLALAVEPNGTNQSEIYVYPVKGDSLNIDSWDYAFKKQSGLGCTWNGTAFTPDIKQPGTNLYIGTKKTAKEGDVLTIGGTFVNEDQKLVINISNTMLQYTNGTWKVLKGNAVTYKTSAGTVTDYAKAGKKYTLGEGKSFNTVVAWVDANGKVYKPGDVIEVTGPISLEAVELEFNMVAGASIRIATLAENSGIRFTTMINAEQLAKLAEYGITVAEYGTLILPYDYLKVGQTPNLNDFTHNVDIIKIVSTKHETETMPGYVVFRGAIKNLYNDNYDRLFAGCGYITLTINGEKITYYTPFDRKANVRSIYKVANAFMADDSVAENGELRYNDFEEGDPRIGVVNAYVSNGEIKLLDYSKYENNLFEVIAWNYPKLNPENNYDNTTNDEIAKQMKAAGIKVVNLTGASLGEALMYNDENVEKTRSIIHFFWSHGLKTVAFMGVNAGKVDHIAADYFTNAGVPDFSDCPGFIGFLFWDEPNYNTDGTILDGIVDIFVNLAEQFDTLYAGTGVAYINNLYPSYASGLTNTATYKKYVEDYCESVLKNIDGEKWLSVDSYPIKTDKTLDESFLFDLGVIKTYSLQYGAKSHVALQSSGWGAKGTMEGEKSRIPTEQEMRMQAYAAMAFGIDSISWFTYSPSESETEDFNTFVDKDGSIIDKDSYDAFAKVNKELGQIGSVYSALEWKGVILGIGSNKTTYNYDYNAYNRVKNQLSIGGKNYQLTASDTRHIASISKTTNYNYLMGVMEDMNGNEAYVLCNYNSFKTGTFVKNPKDLEVTLNFESASKIKSVVIYKRSDEGDEGIVKETLSVNNNSLTIKLAHAEGMIVLPSTASVN